MAQDFGPAQPLYDAAKGIYKKVSSIVGDSSPKQVDTGKKYQADPDDVRKANESFRKSADAEKPAAKRVSTQKPTTSKKAPSKSTARKKLALKNN